MTTDLSQFSARDLKTTLLSFPPVTRDGKFKVLNLKSGLILERDDIAKITLIIAFFPNIILSIVAIDQSREAPGVEGIGAPGKLFWVWQDGDGHSGQCPQGRNLTRDPYNGWYFTVSSFSTVDLKKS